MRRASVGTAARRAPRASSRSPLGAALALRIHAYFICCRVLCRSADACGYGVRPTAFVSSRRLLLGVHLKNSFLRLSLSRVLGRQGLAPMATCFSLTPPGTHSVVPSPPYKIFDLQWPGTVPHDWRRSPQPPHPPRILQHLTTPLLLRLRLSLFHFVTGHAKEWPPERLSRELHAAAGGRKLPAAPQAACGHPG